MLRKKYFIPLILILILVISLSACKKENKEEEFKPNLSGIMKIVNSIDEDESTKELKGLISELKDLDNKDDIREVIEEKIIGKSKGRLPKYIEFGLNYKDFAYKDERINFLNKTWEIVPYFNLNEEMSAVILNYKYSYENKSPEAFKEDIQSILTILVKEYGAIIYSENPTFESISELDKNRLYMAFESDNFYLGTYVINDTESEEVIFTLAYFSKEFPHKQYSEYFPILTHMENAVKFKKGYSDLRIQYIQGDGQIINYSRDFHADDDTKKLLKIMSIKLPPLEESEPEQRYEIHDDWGEEDEHD